MLQLTIPDNKYRDFVKYAVETCDTFSLVFEKDCENKKYILQEFFYMISEFIIYKKTIDYHPDTGTFFENADIIYCDFNKHTGAFFQITGSIFDWNGQRFPEELCFYKNKKKWFTCISHEKILLMHNETLNDIDFLKRKNIKYYSEK